ncbi:MAG TPA: hypothetical protein VE594_03520 [Nitrososphaeraceae archaeon]|nr:hypothetical protein [Nitrososphaeraceae archaeon]
MSSKVDQLENQQDPVTNLSQLKKSKGNYETDRQNKVVPITDNFTTGVVINDDESNKTHREINIEIDIFQRTTVFSSDFTMWI